jgi:hypothetical protein
MVSLVVWEPNYELFLSLTGLAVILLGFFLIVTDGLVDSILHCRTFVEKGDNDSPLHRRKNEQGEGERPLLPPQEKALLHAPRLIIMDGLPAYSTASKKEYQTNDGRSGAIHVRDIA